MVARLATVRVACPNSCEFGCRPKENAMPFHASTFAAGFVDITPTRPLPLAGYGARMDVCEGIADRLEANVVVMQDVEAPIIVVSFDLLYVGDLLRGQLEQALPEVPAE